MSATTIVTCLYADTLDFHIIGVTLALVWRHALTVTAILATRYAYTSVSITLIFCSVLDGDTRVQDLNIHDIHAKETVIAFANLRCNACAVVTHPADGHALAGFCSLVIVDARANLRCCTCAIAALDIANWLAFERHVNVIIMDHVITILANARIRRHTVSMHLASWMTNRITHVHGTR